jgi:hypothetical protein
MVAIVVFLFSNRAAPIATSMVVVRPGTIGPHPKGTAPAPDGCRRLFCFAMQSAARAAEKAGDGCCGKTIEAKPVFGQTQSIRGRRWTAQMEIIWNKTCKRPRRFRKQRRQHRVGHNRPGPSMAGFSDTVFRGDTVGL